MPRATHPTCRVEVLGWLVCAVTNSATIITVIEICKIPFQVFLSSVLWSQPHLMPLKLGQEESSQGYKYNPSASPFLFACWLVGQVPSPGLLPKFAAGSNLV